MNIAELAAARRRLTAAGVAIAVCLALAAAAHSAPAAVMARCDRVPSPPDAIIQACTAALQDSALQPAARAHLLVIRAQAEDMSGKDAEALADFSQVIDLDSKQVQAVNDQVKRRGPGYAQTTSIAGAYTGLLNADLAAAYGERGKALRIEGKLDAAMADLDAALKIAPDYPMALQQRGVAWRQTGRIDLALADLDAAIRIRPNWAPPYVTRGAIYTDQGDDDRALADLNEAIRLAPKFADAYVNRTVVRVDKHDYAGALADINVVIGMQPNAPSALVDRAIVWAHEGELEKAVADDSRAIDLFAAGHVEPAGDPWLDTSRDYMQTLTGRSNLYLELGDFAAAREDADRAVPLAPTLYDAWNNRCWVRGATNVELTAALTDCDRALELAKTQRARAEVLDSRALVRYRQGQFDLAVADENDAIAASSSEPSFRFLKGLAEERLGKAAEGQTDIAAALAADPKLADLYAKWGLKPD